LRIFTAKSLNYDSFLIIAVRLNRRIAIGLTEFAPDSRVGLHAASRHPN
jgi:hypothetical protein